MAVLLSTERQERAILTGTALTAKRCGQLATSIKGRESNLVRRSEDGSVEPFPAFSASRPASFQDRSALLILSKPEKPAKF
jgi:hypothetical protein